MCDTDVEVMPLGDVSNNAPPSVEEQDITSDGKAAVEDGKVIAVDQDVVAEIDAILVPLAPTPQCTPPLTSLHPPLTKLSMSPERQAIIARFDQAIGSQSMLPPRSPHLPRRQPSSLLRQGQNGSPSKPAAVSPFRQALQKSKGAREGSASPSKLFDDCDIDPDQSNLMGDCSLFKNDNNLSFSRQSPSPLPEQTNGRGTQTQSIRSSPSKSSSPVRPSAQLQASPSKGTRLAPSRARDDSITFTDDSTDSSALMSACMPSDFDQSDNESFGPPVRKKMQQYADRGAGVEEEAPQIPDDLFQTSVRRESVSSISSSAVKRSLSASSSSTLRGVSPDISDDVPNGTISRALPRASGRATPTAIPSGAASAQATPQASRNGVKPTFGRASTARITPRQSTSAAGPLSNSRVEGSKYPPLSFRRSITARTSIATPVRTRPSATSNVKETPRAGLASSAATPRSHPPASAPTPRSVRPTAPRTSLAPPPPNATRAAATPLARRSLAPSSSAKPSMSAAPTPRAKATAPSAARQSTANAIANRTPSVPRPRTSLAPPAARSSVASTVGSRGTPAASRTSLAPAGRVSLAPRPVPASRPPPTPSSRAALQSRASIAGVPSGRAGLGAAKPTGSMTKSVSAPSIARVRSAQSSAMSPPDAGGNAATAAPQTEDPIAAVRAQESIAARSSAPKDEPMDLSELVARPRPTRVAVASHGAPTSAAVTTVPQTARPRNSVSQIGGLRSVRPIGSAAQVPPRKTTTGVPRSSSAIRVTVPIRPAAPSTTATALPRPKPRTSTIPRPGGFVARTLAGKTGAEAEAEAGEEHVRD